MKFYSRDMDGSDLEINIWNILEPVITFIVVALVFITMLMSILMLFCHGVHYVLLLVSGIVIHSQLVIFVFGIF